MIDVHRSTTTFLCRPCARRVDEDAPHDLSRQREKTDALVPIDVLRVDQTQVRLVDRHNATCATQAPASALDQHAQRWGPGMPYDTIMDSKIRLAMAAIKADDLEQLRTLVAADRSLATSRSSTSHPTLLQCLVLSGKHAAHKLDMARLLIAAGAELNESLVACGSCDNVEVAELLLDSGAALNGTGGWSPLEEALYWNSRRVEDLLVRRGATAHNLRIASGLGRLDLMERFFNADGSLKPTAGSINWPWGDLEVIEHSNFDEAGRRQLAARFSAWKNDRQDIINNAFVYACMHGHVDAADHLLARGAEMNVIPGGFDYAGTGLHYAALNGHRPMVESI